MIAPLSAPASSTLPLRHLLLGLAVVAVWGTNFVVIKYALAHLPPLALAALRFALAAFPALLFIGRPAASWRNVAAYGLLIGVAQFGLMFIAMTRFVSPGLASLVVQVQVFFTIGLAMLLAGERVRVFQVLAMALSVAGMVLVLLALLYKKGHLPELRRAGSTMLLLVPLLLVPVSVGIMEQADLLAANWWPLTAALLVSIVAGMVATGWTIRVLRRLDGQAGDDV